MKNIVLSFFLIIGTSSLLFSQSTSKELPSGYYMVLAAYAQLAEAYAKKYVSFLKDKDVDAKYGFRKAKIFFSFILPVTIQNHMQ